MNNTSYHIEKNKLFIEGKEIDFDYSISKLLPILDMSVVLLDIPMGETENNNVYGIRAGEVVWRVESPLHLFPRFIQTPYEQIVKTESNELVLTDFNAFRYLVNPQNGNILERLHEVR